jgi:hypothetical protein
LDDWKDAFCASPELDAEVCTVTDLVAFAKAREKLTQYPLVVVLHSVAGDRMSFLLRVARWFRRRRGKLVVFIGNEYDLMAEKIQFLSEAGADYICSQLPLATAAWLYEACRDSRVVPMPHALNPSAYVSKRNGTRPIDIGFVGDLYERLIGDDERTRIVRYFECRGAELGLTCDIRSQRMPRAEWAGFLNTCKGVIGAESGTYYLDRDGRILREARAFLAEHPSASFDEVFDQCFRHATSFVSGKAVSSRHFEPIGTRTCQILVEGAYNGILRAGRHYIPVRRDLSDIGDAIRQLLDEGIRQRIVDEAYAYVRAEHTYAHRVASLLRLVGSGDSPTAVPASVAEAVS